MHIPFLTSDLHRELDLRLEKVRKEMLSDNLDAIIIASSANMLYMSGCIFRGYVYVTHDRAPLFFLIPPSYADNTDYCIPIRKPEQIAGRLEEDGYGLPRRLGVEFSDMLYSDVERLR